MALQICTLTGADEDCTSEQILKLSVDRPWLEWGLLWSPRRSGSSRYPSLHWISDTLRALASAGVRSSVHLCHEGVDAFIEHEPTLMKALSAAGRVQLNFNFIRTPWDLRSLDGVISTFGRPVITQHNTGNQEMSLELLAANHQILFDSSGGRGTRPSHWPAPLTGKMCGYAGGLGPEVISDALPGIEQASAGHDHWIDMESGLRDAQGRLCWARCETVAAQVDRWLSSTATQRAGAMSS